MKKKIYIYIHRWLKKQSTAKNIHIKILAVEKKRPFKLGIILERDLILQTFASQDKLKPNSTLFEELFVPRSSKR